MSLCCPPQISCLISRACFVWPLSAAVNCARKPEDRIPGRHQFMMWFSGLRGAIAFALSLGVPTESGSLILTTTLCIVLFTVIILGGAAPKMLELLKIPMHLDPELVRWGAGCVRWCWWCCCKGVAAVTAAEQMLVALQARWVPRCVARSWLLCASP